MVIHQFTRPALKHEKWNLGNRLLFLFWHFKSSCRGRKRNPPVVKISSNRIYCPAFTACVLALFTISDKRLDASHYTQLPLFLHIAIREFPMEKTFLVFSQLEGHKANALCLCQVLNSLQTGRASWTGQHRQCSCCRHATGSARGEKGSKGQPWIPGTNSSCAELQRHCNPVFCVTSHFWVLKGRKWDYQTKFPLAVHTEVNQSPLSVTRALHCRISFHRICCKGVSTGIFSFFHSHSSNV